MKYLILLAQIDMSLMSFDSNPIGMISTILSLIVLIVFFFMAVNIKKIKNSLTHESSDRCFEQAKKYEFMREKEKALEMYLEGIYLEVKDFVIEPERKKNREASLRREFGDKITELGGEWPDFDLIK